MSSLKKITRSVLLLTLIFSCIVSFEEIRELSFQHTASKAQPFRINGRTVCSSSQVRYKGARFTITNRHCCQVLKRVDPALTDDDLVGKVVNIGDLPREIIEIDTKHDLCALEPDMSKPSLRLARSYKIGEPVHIVGHPRGMPQTIRPGRIIGKASAIFPWISRAYTSKYITASVIGYPGNSGSPIIDRFGQLVGVCFAGSRAYHTELHAVPLESIKEFLDRILE